MANNEKDRYHDHTFYHEQQLINHSSSSSSFLPSQNFQGFDPSHATFNDYLHGSMDYNTLSRAFDLSCSSPEVNISSIDNENNSKKPSSVGDSVGMTMPTPNSSVSCSSNEADQAIAEEDSTKIKKDKEPKGTEDGDHQGSKKEWVFFTSSLTLSSLF